jgi:ribosomal protein S12 methylthiotransferase accessory factor YcaO
MDPEPVRALEMLPHDDPAALLARVGAAAGDCDPALLTRVAPRLRALFRLPTPTASGATMIGAVLDAGGEAGLSASGLGPGAPEALARCLGEAAETISQAPRPGDAVAEGSLDRPPAGHGLSAAELDAAARRGIVRSDVVGWLAAVRLPDGAPCLLPAPLCLRTRGGVAAGAGCAAGPTRDAARRAAALEAFERAALADWARAGAGRGLDLAAACAAAAFLDALRGGAARLPVRLLDIGVDAAPPVVLAQSDLGQGVAAGETVADAARAALREMIAAETGALISAARGAPPPPMRRLAARTAPEVRPASLAEAIARLAEAGFPMRAVDLTRADLAAPVAKVVCFGVT